MFPTLIICEIFYFRYQINWSVLTPVFRKVFSLRELTYLFLKMMKKFLIYYLI